MHRSNTTFDIYLGGRLPPAVPDVAGLAGLLVDEWVRGNEANKRDRKFLFTATLEVVLGVNLPDAYPGAVGETTVWVPDHTGAAYTVVFVERERSFRGGDFQRVYLIKGSVVAITVEDVNLVNVYPNTTIIQFADADGFLVSSPAANTACINLQDAGATQVGKVNTAAQTFAGAKTFLGTVTAQDNLNVGVVSGGVASGNVISIVTTANWPEIYGGSAVGGSPSALVLESTHNSPGPPMQVIWLELDGSVGANGGISLYAGQPQAGQRLTPAIRLWNGGSSGSWANGASGTDTIGNVFVAGINTTIGTGGVGSLNGLTGALTIAAGSGISVSASGSTITISATGGGSGTVTSISANSPISVSPNPITTTGTISHNTSGATAGTYTNATVTVDAYGHVTAASAGSAGGIANTSQESGAAVKTFTSVGSWVDTGNSLTLANQGTYLLCAHVSGSLKDTSPNGVNPSQLCAALWDSTAGVWVPGSQVCVCSSHYANPVPLGGMVTYGTATIAVVYVTTAANTVIGLWAEMIANSGSPSSATIFASATSTGKGDTSMSSVQET